MPKLTNRNLEQASLEQKSQSPSPLRLKARQTDLLIHFEHMATNLEDFFQDFFCNFWPTFLEDATPEWQETFLKGKDQYS